MLATQYLAPLRLRVIPLVKEKLPKLASDKQCVLVPPLPPERRDDSKIALSLELAAQPGFGISSISSLRIEKAMDDQGQDLHPLTDLVKEQRIRDDVQDMAMLQLAQRVLGGGTVAACEKFSDDRCRAVPLHLFKAAKPSKLIKDIKGSVSVLVWSPYEESVRITDMLQAVGRRVEGEYGVTIKILAASRESDGRMRVHFELAIPQRLTAASPWDASKVILPYLEGQLGRLSLEDDQGSLAPELIRTESKDHGGQPIWSVHAVFRPSGKRRPERFVFAIRRSVSFSVPFAFSNISLQSSALLTPRSTQEPVIGKRRD